MPPYMLKLCLMYKSRLGFGFKLSFLWPRGGDTCFKECFMDRLGEVPQNCIFLWSITQSGLHPNFLTLFPTNQSMQNKIGKKRTNFPSFGETVPFMQRVKQCRRGPLPFLHDGFPQQGFNSKKYFIFVLQYFLLC